MSHSRIQCVPAIETIVSESCKVDRSKQCYVYVLLKDGLPVYVGQSSNIAERICQHIKRKDFDAYWSMPVSEEEASAVEADFILALNPPLNWQLPTQDVYLSDKQARKLITAVKLRKAEKAGIVTPLYRSYGIVYLVSQVKIAIEKFGGKHEQ